MLILAALLQLHVSHLFRKLWVSDVSSDLIALFAAIDQLFRYVTLKQSRCSRSSKGPVSKETLKTGPIHDCSNHIRKLIVVDNASIGEYQILSSGFE